MESDPIDFFHSYGALRCARVTLYLVLATLAGRSSKDGNGNCLTRDGRLETPTILRVYLLISKT